MSQELQPYSYGTDEWKALVCSGDFLTISEAMSVAKGRAERQYIDLVSYYQAWQYLLDNDSFSEEADILYADKLLCDGIIFSD